MNSLDNMTALEFIESTQFKMLQGYTKALEQGDKNLLQAVKDLKAFHESL